jgi:DNA repair protein RadC
MEIMERCKKFGPSVLSDKELLNLVLGTKDLDVPASKWNGSLKKLANQKGMTDLRACRIKAGLELFHRAHLTNKVTKIESEEDVVSNYMPQLMKEKKEIFMVIGLDTRNVITYEETVSIGTLNASLVHPREVFRKAIEESAAAIILIHNHPSGDPDPSDADVKMTEQLAEAGRIIGIELMDHVIIGDGIYKSLSYLI